MNSVSLSWISFYQWSYWQCLSDLCKEIANKASQLVVTPNPEMLYEAQNDSELLEVLKNAHLALPDGAGIFVAYQITESKLPSLFKYVAFPFWCLRAIIHSHSLVEEYGERITGARLTRDLIAYAAEMKIPVTIIDPVVSGDSEWDKRKRVSQETMKVTLEEKFPWLDCQIIISNVCPETINNGIIFATHGNGRQEKLLAETIKRHPNCGLCIGVGGSIDLLTWFRQPAPELLKRFGGEWLYRLYKNPSRHWKRMKKVIVYLLQQFA